MTTINETFTNALLADATYVHKLQAGESGGDLVRKLSERMTPTLADYIAKNFSVVTQIESGDNVLTDSGFDATVWRQTDGKLYVSIDGPRHSELPWGRIFETSETRRAADWLADCAVTLYPRSDLAKVRRLVADAIAALPR